jgi:hypothetical protein
MVRRVENSWIKVNGEKSREFLDNKKLNGEKSREFLDTSEW